MVFSHSGSNPPLSRFILQIAIETGTLSQYNGQNTVINAT
jgi:hypothetical protein